MADANRPSDALPGFVLWPGGEGERGNRLCVLISDVHCTDCTVGNQTASENDWQRFFEQLEFAASNPYEEANCAYAGRARQVDELILVLNGDIIDLIRSSRWAEAGVYPWHRSHPRFAAIVLDIMREIVRIHADQRSREARLYTGFFYWMRRCIARLRARGMAVTVIPVAGNHDKELQVVAEARRMFYERCLGITARDITQDYRGWVAAQLGTPPDDPYPRLPFYFADAGLRLLATHGHWRDQDNTRATHLWNPLQGWAPQRWREEQYRAFTEPCFGDTVVAGMLSRFIWSAAAFVDRSTASGSRLCKLLNEMDLYRPSVRAVVRLLQESRRMARQNSEARGLHERLVDCFRDCLRAWLAHAATRDSAWGSTRLGLFGLSCLSRLRIYRIEFWLMQLMAKAQEPESSIARCRLLTLPAFRPEYRALGLRLHVEGHTHVALEEDVQFGRYRRQVRRHGKADGDRNNFTYINLGAWRDRIVPKRNRGFRRRGTGRALFVFDLARADRECRDGHDSRPRDHYRFYVWDTTSWSDGKDSL